MLPLTPTSGNIWSHTQRQFASHLTCNRGSRKQTSPDFDLGTDTITQLKDIVLDKNRQHRLPNRTPSEESTVTTPTHLEFRHREVLPQTRSRSIPKGKQVPIPLNFFRFGGRILEPSTWLEVFSVLTPDCGGAIHGFN